jgi:hypothetical protein
MTMSDAQRPEAGPNSARHRRQRKKNLVTLALLLAFVALVYVIAMIKLQSGQ